MRGFETPKVTEITWEEYMLQRQLPISVEDQPKIDLSSQLLSQQLGQVTLKEELL